MIRLTWVDGGYNSHYASFNGVRFAEIVWSTTKGEGYILRPEFPNNFTEKKFTGTLAQLKEKAESLLSQWVTDRRLKFIDEEA